MNLTDRLRAALQAWRDPACVNAVPPLDEDDGPPDPVAPGLFAKPVYEHWHPGGRSIYGWLVMDSDGGKIHEFIVAEDPLYGAGVDAHELRRRLAPR